MDKSICCSSWAQTGVYDIPPISWYLNTLQEGGGKIKQEYLDTGFTFFLYLKNEQILVNSC